MEVCKLYGEKNENTQEKGNSHDIFIKKEKSIQQYPKCTFFAEMSLGNKPSMPSLQAEELIVCGLAERHIQHSMCKGMHTLVTMVEKPRELDGSVGKVSRQAGRQAGRQAQGQVACHLSHCCSQ